MPSDPQLSLLQQQIQQRPEEESLRHQLIALLLEQGDPESLQQAARHFSLALLLKES